MSCLLVSGLWGKLQPDDVAGIGNTGYQSERFVTGGSAEPDLGMDVVIRDPRQKVGKRDLDLPDGLDDYAAIFLAHVYRGVSRSAACITEAGKRTAALLPHLFTITRWP